MCTRYLLNLLETITSHGVEALIALHPPRLLFMDLPATQCTLSQLLLRLLLRRRWRLQHGLQLLFRV